MKECCACREIKPPSDFSRRAASKDGLQHRCRSCANKRQAEWRRANPEKAKGYARDYYRRNAPLVRLRDRKTSPDRRLARYGLTAEAYAERLAAQGGRCAICRTDRPGGRGVWHIDHDHACCDRKGSCGSCVRGLLCYSCNAALGFIKDNPRTALSAARYLEG